METLADPRHKISRQFKVLNHFKEHGWAYPVSVEIDPTWNCSLNCKGCHSKWLHKDQELSQADIVSILRELSIHGLKSVTWSGGGEPLEWTYWQFGMMEARRWKLDQGLYSYMPAPNQAKVDFLEACLSWAYTHNFRTKGLNRQKPSSMIWTAGWLLDKETWPRVNEYIEKTDLGFFNFVDFRPLILEGADYSWVKQAIKSLEKLDHPQVKWATYKFEDLLKPDKGRTYSTCYSTDFSASIGPNGDMFQCLNRRGITVIGNLLKEDLETIWKRKVHAWCDFTQCRALCRGHEMNKELEYLLGPEPLHASFV